VSQPYKNEEIRGIKGCAGTQNPRLKKGANMTTSQDTTQIPIGLLLGGAHMSYGLPQKTVAERALKPGEANSMIVLNS
jgi:hypothetical protein